MNKETLILLLTTLVITAGMVGGLHYWYLHRQGLLAEPREVGTRPGFETGERAPQPAPASTPAPVARSGAIIECPAPDGTRFYTNAPSCEEADLDNRLSEAQRYRSVARPGAEPALRRAATAGGRAGRSSNSPSLPGYRQTPGSVPRACKWEWGRALEIERMLAAADEPGESRWVPNYCQRLCEAFEEGCRPTGDDFHFIGVCAPLPGSCRRWR